MFDLNLIPFAPETSDQTGMPGLAAVAPPRRPARGRSDQLLVCLVNLQGSAPLSAGGLQELVDRMAQTFYATPGSVTSALRSAADSLNQYLLERNLRNTGANRQVFALLNLAAVGDGQVFLAHSGPTHSFVLAPKVEHFYDAQLAGRGLGLTRTLALRYYQASVGPGSALLFSSEPPANWNETTLAGSAGLPLENLLRRLLVQAPASLRAALVQISSGSGKIHYANSAGRPAAAPTPAPAAPATVTPAVSTAQPPVSSLAPTFQSAPSAAPPLKPAPVQPVADQRQPIPDRAAPAAAGPVTPTPQPIPPPSQPQAAGSGGTPPTSLPAGEGAIPPTPLTPRPASTATSLPTGAPAGETIHPAVTPAPSGAPPARAGGQAASRPLPSPGGPAALRPIEPTGPRDEPVIQEMRRIRRRRVYPAWLVTSWGTLRAGLRRTGQAVQTLLARMLPGVGDRAPVLSPAAMVFIALAVPLVVAAVALAVYFEKGQAEQYRLYFIQAQTALAETNSQKDPKLIRNSAERTLLLLDKADTYQVTNDSRALRTQAQNQLDQLDSVARLDFQPAIIGSLSQTAQITDLVATANDLYLLDASQGRVLRAALTGRGYELDTQFDCGPGPTGNLIIGQVIDIAPLPINNPVKATVLALDKSGNLLYCLPDKPPYSRQLAPPDNNWGRIAAMSLDSDTLYILDPEQNAIQVYAPVGGAFSERPHLFFQKDGPPMGDGIDLVVNAQDLYLLHADGHLTTCTFSNQDLEPVRCTDPAPISDPRSGMAPAPVIIQGTRFSQILYTPPPNPSIYFLDPGTATIYQFSLRLNLNLLLRSQSLADYLQPGARATAFTIDPNQRAFLAFGSRVFYTTVLH